MVTPKGDQGSGSAVHTEVLAWPSSDSRVTEASALTHVLCTEHSRPAEAKPAGRACGRMRGGGIVGARAMPSAFLEQLTALVVGLVSSYIGHWSHDGNSGLRWETGILQQKGITILALCFVVVVVLKTALDQWRKERFFHEKCSYGRGLGHLRSRPLAVWEDAELRKAVELVLSHQGAGGRTGLARGPVLQPRSALPLLPLPGLATFVTSVSSWGGGGEGRGPAKQPVVL